VAAARPKVTKRPSEGTLAMSETIKQRSAAVTPRRINHLVLNVHNIEESQHFWSDLVGFKQVGELHRCEDGNRVNHGMTHSVHINDPNGYGAEVLYELPAEVWSLRASSRELWPGPSRGR
jgi:catechol-2,3-dioxygenase